ncbi:MAG: hypothetical protein B6244_07325 [Candidatus Cloacimonetes bacterium 4572_55]|nr:MAG: hypothetical protein B6244_07325 [Candidatus Cloacimonetes bacterium 4572_55]
MNIVGIGKRIKEIRGRRSQTNFGKLFDLSLMQVRGLEKGALTKEHVVRGIAREIAEKESVNYHWILTGEKKDSKEKTDMVLRDSQAEFGADSPRQIIRAYFELYPDREKKLSALIRNKKIEHFFGLIE